MEREQIVREDFPTARKGWSRDAVRDHLIAVAEAFPDAKPPPPPAAVATSERVESVIAAAEEAAAEIVAEARAEADRTLGAASAEAEQIRAAARTESEQRVTAASREASGRVEQARGAVEGLISQADKLRAQVGALGRDLASNVPGAGGSDEATAAAEPLVVPEVAPEPTDRPEPEAKPAATDDELIAQLRGSPGPAVGEDEPDSDPPAPAISGSDLGAARLVAMNMALEGASRDQIAKQIKTEFGDMPDVGGLLDDVLRRAQR
jgi:cell division septum initiation protein DivIVA